MFKKCKKVGMQEKHLHLKVLLCNQCQMNKNGNLVNYDPFTYAAISRICGEKLMLLSIERGRHIWCNEPILLHFCGASEEDRHLVLNAGNFNVLSTLPIDRGRPKNLANVSSFT